MTGLPVVDKRRLSRAQSGQLPWKHWPERQQRLVTFALVGTLCTIVFALLYAAFRTWLGPAASNATALSGTLGVNFTLNRWLTWRAASGSIAKHIAGYALVYVFGAATSTAALNVALLVLNSPSRGVETGLAVAAGGIATVLRFVLLSAWVFRQPPAPASGRAPATTETRSQRADSLLDRN